MAIIQTSINDLQTLTFTPNSSDIYYTVNQGQEGNWYYSYEQIHDYTIPFDPLDPPNIYQPINTNNIGTVISINASSTHRHVFRRIFDGYVDVKWFGAKGDGYNLDHVAIQNALDYISTTNYDKINNEFNRNTYGGNTLFFPEGRYLISKTLLVGAHCKMLGVTRGGQFNPAYYYPFTYPNFTGSVILFELGVLEDGVPQNRDNWVIDTACYNLNPLDPDYEKLLGISEVITGPDLDSTGDIPPKNNQSSGIVIENLIIDGCQFYNPPFPAQALYGGIKLSGTINAVIRNVTIVNVKIGIMLSASWSSSLENVRVFTNYYGIVLYNNNFTKLSSCYISGKRLQDLQRTDISSYEALIEGSFYPDSTEFDKAFYNRIDLNSAINDFGFDVHFKDIIKRAKTGIWIGDSHNICLLNTIVEYFTNGITQLVASSTLTDCYLEGNRYASIVVAGQTLPILTGGKNIKLPSNLVVNGLHISSVGEGQPKDNGIAGIGFGYYFGNHVLASLNSVVQYTSSNYSPLFHNNWGVNRNIVFEKTVFSSRTYQKDIQFTDEGVNGQNLGSVYVDPTGGSDENYGFNNTDAIKTFDAALIRVQNQSTINPVKTIYIKAAPLIHEGRPTVFAAVKNLDIVSIQNADILITTYDTDDQHVRGKIYFDGDPSGEQMAMIGQIELLGNVNLYFRNVDLITNDAQLMSANPVNLSMFGLTNAYSKVTFEVFNKPLLPPPFQDINIYVNFCYFLFQANNSLINATRNDSLLDVKFLNIVLSSNSTFFLSAVNLSPDLPFAPAILGVDCVQINSILPIPNYSLPNRGWNNSIIIRNNF